MTIPALILALVILQARPTFESYQQQRTNFKNMKTVIIIIATLIITNVTAQAQIASNDTQEDQLVMIGVPSGGNDEKVVSFYQQLDQHTAQLKEVREEYKQKFETATTEEEKAEMQEVLNNIDEMIQTNQRLKEGKAMIQTIETADNTQ